MSTPRHPPSEYGTIYPYNRATVTESGHELHLDDTPGRERIRLAHRTGTYTETGPDGRQVNMVVDHRLDYVKGGLTTTIDKNSDSKVGGSDRRNVSGDQHLEVAGDSSSSIGGSDTRMVGSDRVEAVGGDYVLGVLGKHSARVGGAMDLKVDGAGTLNFGGGLTLESAQSITLKVGESTIVIGPDNIQLRSSRIDLN